MQRYSIKKRTQETSSDAIDEHYENVHHERPLRTHDADKYHDDDDKQQGFCFIARCGVKSALGKRLAQLACLILILIMMCGIAVAGYHILKVYWSMEANNMARVSSRERREAGRPPVAMPLEHFDTHRSRRRREPDDPVETAKPSWEQTKLFRQAAVSADTETCSEIGKEFLLPPHNGNAVDAALATLICNGLHSMQSMGLGGGFVANVYIARDQKAYTLNARERDPSGDRRTSDADNSAYDTPEQIAVPGEALGYGALHERFGSVPWPDLWAPSIRMCSGGYETNAQMANHYREAWFQDEQLMPVFYAINDTLVRPTSLCRVYERLAARGAADFYSGTVAELVLADLREMGAAQMRAADLRDYRVQWSDALSVPLARGGDDGGGQPAEEVEWLHVTPLPSSGPLVAMMMRVLNEFEGRLAGEERAMEEMFRLHRMAEVFKYAFSERMKMGDPEFVDGMEELIANITSESYAKHTQQRIEKHGDADPNPLGIEPGEEHLDQHGTSHVSVIAPNGDAVSVTSSINYYFGCGRMGRRSGIFFNTALNDFSTDNSYFALPVSGANRRQPGKRPMSSMAPLIVTTRRDGVQLVAGAAGGTRIPTALVNVLMAALRWRRTLKEAVDGPRIHHQCWPETLENEFGLRSQLVFGLKALGHKMRRAGDSRRSMVTALARNETGVFGLRDHRKHGGKVSGF